ncbi:putative cyclin-dependent kinase F-2 [Triticum dicoccoides]|uniref:putative cyclin-dependent kinase F-2 n=1 Tax=Triticum dicoccoides TaxID=85692 RepID=UPI00188FD2FE|nr:putative cyclin-dependent kinase F-2 [Triticum dicoccoides]
MAACNRKRPAAVHATTAQHQQSPTRCKRSRAFIGSTDDYVEVNSLGQGGFGVVLRLRHKVTKKDLAVKFLSSPDETEDGADVEDLYREARFLEACKGNPYVVGFEGLVHKHNRHVVHRDIKPGNILVGETRELVKICDLGLAISLSDKPPYNQAGTAPYMAPEMIMGKRDYDALVDTWSIGCVFAELLTGKTLFACDGQDDDDDDKIKVDIYQLWSIFRVLGVPDERTWPGFTSLPHTTEALRLLPAGHNHSRLRDLFPEEKLSEEGFQVLQGLLTCNPDKRLTAAAALKHPWFAAPRSTAAAAGAKVDALSPAMPEKNVLKIPLDVWKSYLCKC